MTDRLWAPWRRRYLVKSARARPASGAGGCLFCRVRRSRQDRRNLVLHRGRHALAMLNLYPYTNGHLLIAPYRHVVSFARLSDDELLDLWRVTDQFVERLTRRLSPHGYNVGVNLGRAAGAGIPGHLHVHIVPRWHGDTNFMSVSSDVRVISDSLASAYRLLAS